MYTYFVEMKVCFTYFVEIQFYVCICRTVRIVRILRIVQKFRVVFTLQNFGIGQTDRFFLNDNIPKWYFF
jgi:hypothetical protein